jgi:internalin A
VNGLTSLNLSRTKITDAGLAHLRSLTKLQDLNLVDTSVTRAGVQRLQKAMPAVRIEEWVMPQPEAEAVDDMLH